MKFNIRETFETFWAEPLSILTKGLFQLVNIQSGILGEKSVNVDKVNNRTQITVVNSDSMFKLFQTVLCKRRMGEKSLLK